MSKRLRREKRYRVVAGRGIGVDPFDAVKETQDTRLGLIDLEVESLPICAHGHVIRDLEELGGACAVCGRYLCTECSTLTCCIDDRLLCRDHGYGGGNDRAICSTHGFLSRFLFVFFQFPK